MGKSVTPREKIIQKSVCIKNRQQDLIYYMEQNFPNFDLNKMVRDMLDTQAEIFAPQFLEGAEDE